VILTCGNVEKCPFPNAFFDAVEPVAGLQAYQHFMWIEARLHAERAAPTPET
jgi:hypothetical protein